MPALLVSGGSFAGCNSCWSNYGETGLVDIVASIFSLLVMVAFLKVWTPPNVIGDRLDEVVQRPFDRRAVLKGWSPFILASILIFIFAFRL